MGSTCPQLQGVNTGGFGGLNLSGLQGVNTGGFGGLDLSQLQGVNTGGFGGLDLSQLQGVNTGGFGGLDLSQLQNVGMGPTQYIRDRGRLASGREADLAQRGQQLSTLQGLFGDRTAQLAQRQADLSQLDPHYQMRFGDRGGRNADMSALAGATGRYENLAQAMMGGALSDTAGDDAQRDRQWAERLRRYGGMDAAYGLSGAEDFADERSSIEDAFFGRATRLLDPQIEKQREALTSSLTNQGLIGSQAATDELAQFDERYNRQISDLSMNAVLAGAGEHGRLADLVSRNRGQLFGEQGQLFAEGGQRFGEGQQRFGNVLAAQGVNRDVLNARQGLFGAGGQLFNERGQLLQDARNRFTDQGRIFAEGGELFGEGRDVFDAGGDVFDDSGAVFDDVEGLNRAQEMERQRTFDREMGLRGQQFGEQQAMTDVSNQNLMNLYNQQMGLERGQQFGRAAGHDQREQSEPHEPV